MSLLDMAGELMGGQQNAGAGSSSALSAVLAMVNNHPGGLPGLISAFEQNGLGGVANSWVSPGTPNQPVTGGQVQSVIGGNQLQEVAAKLGLPQEAASGVVAQLLPSIVDHLTPNGQVPASGANLMELGEGMLKNFLK
jgi:uncharacterized protein YidB (DUF937 family)